MNRKRHYFDLRRAARSGYRSRAASGSVAVCLPESPTSPTPLPHPRRPPASNPATTERISMNPRWRVLLLDTKDGNPNHYIVLAIEAALGNHPQVELVRCPGYADALHVAIKEHCNLFLAFDGEGLDRGLCRRLASVCGTSVLWVTEDPYERHVNVQNAVLFDFVFTNDSGSVQAYPRGAYHLPLAAYP